MPNLNPLRALLLLAVLSSPTQALEPLPVAKDVYVFLGDNGEANASNRGFVANSGFIVGPEGVVVIDTGASFVHGQRMLAAIARVTDKPVALVIITHAVQDFVFGAAAFADRGIPLLAHSKTVELMKARCEHCLSNLRKILDVATMQGTRLVLPERTLENSTDMEVGGRSLRLLWLGWASTPGDLVVIDRRSGVIFTGGIITAHRVPELRDGEFDTWLKAIQRLEDLKPARVVPGYGPVLCAGESLQTAGYLRALDAKVRHLYNSGKGLMEAVDNADLPDYAQWSLYPDQHRRNVLRRYLQLEVEELEK